MIYLSTPNALSAPSPGLETGFDLDSLPQSRIDSQPNQSDATALKKSQKPTSTDRLEVLI